MNKLGRQIDIFGVRVDKVDIDQALEMIKKWLKDPRPKKYFITTPNVEFVMLAQKDLEFKQVLSKADLAIPDSARFGWTDKMMKRPPSFSQILYWPRFLIKDKEFPVVTGTDLMEKLVKLSGDWAFTVGFLGGRGGVAKRAADCLKKTYPKSRIVFIQDGLEIGHNGEVISPVNGLKIPPLDILFVAFGQGKQEKWIYKNLSNLPVKIAMGVGGAFDYLSGSVARAPLFLRKLGLEWLFRLCKEPWRFKRQLVLLEYIYRVFSR